MLTIYFFVVVVYDRIFKMATLLYILLALFFLALNSFFVLSEFAIVKIRDTRLKELVNNGNSTAGIAREIVKDLEAYLATCQLGITIASLGLGWTGEPLVAHILSSVCSLFGLQPSPGLSRFISIILALLFTTMIHVVLGEQVPKNVSIRIPEEAVLFVARPLRTFHHIFYHPMWVLNKLTLMMLKLLKVEHSLEETVHTDEELRMILGESQRYGRISLGRLVMFEQLFDFGKTEASEIMTPLRKIVFLDPDSTWQETREVLKNNKLSRYPLLAPSQEKHFYVHLKDLVSILDAESFAPADKPEFDDIKRPLFEIQETLSVERALRIFQEKKLQLALVRNDRGELTGLLSMEDIVEELTGEIRDEFDNSPEYTLSSILTPDACIMDLKSDSKEEAIRELVDKLHDCFPHFDKDNAASLIVKRENTQSTALGYRTAFPHARLAELDRPIMAFGKSSKGIGNFSPVDKKTVRLVFLIITPSKYPATQLAILKELSGLVLNKTLLERLSTAKTPYALMDVIRTYEDKVMD